MLFALDKDGNRVYIESTHVKYDYFCPECGEKLVLRKGDIRRHHFAHHSHTNCTDTWHYDMSAWHIAWQDRFPQEQQEIIKNVDGNKHRADVLIEKAKIVLEFQHSALSAEEFVERNAFYNGLGYKVIWIFDVADVYEKGAIENIRSNIYKWTRPKRTFNLFDENVGDVEIYLQLENKAEDNELLQYYLDIIERTGIDDAVGPDGDDYIRDHKDDKGFLVKVTWISPDGFERFAASGYYSIEEFMSMFAKATKVKTSIPREDIYDEPFYLRSRDHTSYYLGCPLSKTHQCIDSTIDISESQYENYRPCEICDYHGKYIQEMKCYKRVADLNIPKEARFISFEKDSSGQLTEIVYELDGVEKTIKLQKVHYQLEEADTIINIWEREKLSIGTFKNIRNGMYVRITKNPRDQVMKYGKLYGRISSDQFSFKGESVEIYYFNNPNWILVWDGNRKR